MPESTVYVVEDDEEARSFAVTLMHAHGFATRGFDSAEAFLAAYTADMAGCLVTDLRLGGMDGIALTTKLREARATLPIVVITAYGDVPTAIRAMKAGANDFIEKPLNPDEFVSVIRQATASLDTSSGSGEADRRQDAWRELTPRERQVVVGIVHGKTNKHVARELGISPRTVEHFRAAAMTKLGVSNLSALVRIALHADAA